MRTELQRQTARLNGAKSRGPITAAGKRRSSQNARRHGLYSRHVLRPPTSNAPAPRPATPDRSIPEQLFHLAYLDYARVAALETRILAEEVERQRTLHPGESDDDLLACAWRHLCDETGVIQALTRLQSAVSRNLKIPAESVFRETNPAISMKSHALPEKAVSNEVGFSPRLCVSGLKGPLTNHRNPDAQRSTAPVPSCPKVSAKRCNRSPPDSRRFHHLGCWCQARGKSAPSDRAGRG